MNRIIDEVVDSIVKYGLVEVEVSARHVHVDWRSRGNYSEIVDCVISRMQMEHLKKRVDEIFCEVAK